MADDKAPGPEPQTEFPWLSITKARRLFRWPPSGVYGSVSEVINSSFIVLIPKIKGAKVIKEYRAISLVTSLYKIIKEVLLNIDCGWFYKK